MQAVDSKSRLDIDIKKMIFSRRTDILVCLDIVIPAEVGIQ